MIDNQSLNKSVYWHIGYHSFSPYLPSFRTMDRVAPQSDVMIDEIQLKARHCPRINRVVIVRCDWYAHV